MTTTVAARRVIQRERLARLRPDRLLRTAGAQQGLLLGAAMMIAGGLDYGVSVLSGRWLAPVEFGIFVAVTALLQILLSIATAIRMVVAFYTARLTVERDASGRIAAFLRRTGRWCARWGLLATAAALLASPLLAAPLRLPSAWPLRAASLMVLMLFLREAVLGALQGTQAFRGLALVQVSQAVLRIVAAGALVLAGAGASGAILAQPIAAVGAVLLGIHVLRPFLRSGGAAEERPVSWSYSASTVLGLAVFGVMTNLDAVFVKLAFSPRVAGDYATVVTFEKMSLFLPWAISFVLFPKVTQRAALGRDPRPILLLAFAAALTPGLALTAVYFLFPGPIVRAVFTNAYSDPGVVLGLASLAGTLHAGINIWLNYALSTGRGRFVGVLLAIVVGQAAAMYLVGRDHLGMMAAVTVAAGVLGNVAGWLTTWFPARAASEVPSAPIGEGAVER